MCCSKCCLNNNKDIIFESDKEALLHIEEHIESGDKVPQYAIDHFEDRLLKPRIVETEI